jgi:hypothetical protein
MPKKIVNIPAPDAPVRSNFMFEGGKLIGPFDKFARAL